MTSIAGIKILKSSALDRIASCRRDLVLDLATQRGAFWESVHALRSRWTIEAKRVLPPAEPPNVCGFAVYIPAAWPPIPTTAQDVWDDEQERLAYERCRAELYPDETAEPEVPVPVDAVWLADWLDDLARLHDQIVPAPCRVSGARSAAAWELFLSACLVYDPPFDQLLAFAFRPRWDLDLAPGAPERLASGQTSVGDEPAMVHAPIVGVRDADAVAEAITASYEELLDVLGSELKREYGDAIDLRWVRRKVKHLRPDLEAQARARLQRVPVHHFIDPDEETTEVDVISALALLRRARGLPPHSNQRPPSRRRDPLTCAQCAIWADDFRMTTAEIARLMGWPLRRDPYGQPRLSDKTTAHIKEGRRLLRERNWRGA